jgi:hypothetical protein
MAKEAAPDAEFRHASGHDALDALVAEHLLVGEAVKATSAWYPSRRGNSPRSPGKKPPEREPRPTA